MMISFSPVRPVNPEQGPGQAKIKPSAAGPQFGGGFWEKWQHPEPVVKYELDQLDAWSGFTPGKTMQELFGITSRQPAAFVITRQLELDKYWKKLNLPTGDKPATNFGEESILLLADERSSATAVQPVVIEYNRLRDEMRIHLVRDESKRNQGTGWYIAKVYNGFLQPLTRRRHGITGWSLLNPGTVSIIYQAAR